MNSEKASLFCNVGRSDKEYHLQLEPKDDCWVVNYQNGRRGSPLKSGTRTTTPLPYDKAKRLYDSIIAEKLRDHYTLGISIGDGYTKAPQSDKFTGVLPQLLHAVPEGEEGPYLDSSDWIMQQKFDGERRPVRAGALGDPVIGINRKGEAVSLPQAASAAIASLQVPHLLADAESIGDRLYVFDLLACGGTDIRAWSFVRRYAKLCEVFAALPPSSDVEIVPVYRTSHDKRRAFEALRNGGAEGVTFKLGSAPYEPGRPASGGPAMKFKFWHTASVLVERINAGKRSVATAVLDRSGSRVEVGSVSIPANQPIPAVGAILEVRYLHAYPGGSLVQATSKGVRDDIDLSECTQDQLYYKKETVEMEEDVSLSP